MNGQSPGKDGLPGLYKMIDLEQIELYDLEQDESETTDVAAAHPEVVKTIQKLADDMRAKLGDSLLEMKGSETRSPGRID